MLDVFYSPMAYTVIIVALAVIVNVVAARYGYLKRSQGRPFPPGPVGFPVIGNILSVSPKGAWVKFTQYKEKYGDLVFFHGLGNTVLVLNSMKAIGDLLEKRAHIYSHRPQFVVAGELMGLGQSMALLPYGHEWRAHRKLAHVAMSPSAVKKYHAIQEDIAALLNRDLLASPEDFMKHVRLTAGRIILSVAYGLSVNDADDKFIVHAESTMLVIGKATVPGAYMFTVKHLPSWMPFHRDAQKGKSMIDQLVTKPYEWVKSKMRSGDAPPSLTQDLLTTNIEGVPDIEHYTKWVTGSLYGAGGETTYATVLTFMMAMALYPDKQKKAQEEIDTLTGLNRLPNMGDHDKLPYVSALIKETMRWHPTLPLSIARRTTEDDVYNGYFIPKGTIIVPNVWSIAFDENTTYSPEQFIPERFLDKESCTPDPTSWAFGFGRRICPGRFLGENSIFILIASILAAFNISLPVEGEMSQAFTLDLVSYPARYNCRITPRSDTIARLVENRAMQCNV